MSPASSVFDDRIEYCLKVMRARDLDEARTLIEQFSRSLGFDNFVFTTRDAAIGTPSKSGSHRFVHNLSGVWGTWAETGVFPWGDHLTHEMVRTAYREPPMFWNSLGQNNLMTTSYEVGVRARRRQRLAGEFGQHSGITIPVHLPGERGSIMSFLASGRAYRPELEPLMLYGHYFASCLQSTFARLLEESPADKPQLSAREIEILRWAAVGKTSWEIALILKISERTVNFHLYRIAGKLGVKGRRAAAAQAIAQGLISL